jgi:hypothetical protein
MAGAIAALQRPLTRCLGPWENVGRAVFRANDLPSHLAARASESRDHRDLGIFYEPIQDIITYSWKVEARAGETRYSLRTAARGRCYSAAAVRGLRPRRFWDGVTTSGVDTAASCDLRRRPISFAIVERRAEYFGAVNG